MSTPNHRIRLGLGALLAGSILAASPLAASAKTCLDNSSARSCTSATSSDGGSGRQVTVRDAPVLRLDAKDHPGYGPVTVIRLDAKDHPGYGPVTNLRLDAKDHPGYGPVTTGGSTSVRVTAGGASSDAHAVAA
jgi:hypothetical protein